jgi:hypothetical protein
MPERGVPYFWYVRRAWRYKRGNQNPSIEEGRQHKMARRPIFFFFLLTLGVPSEGYCRNANMMWGFGCNCSFCWYRKNCLSSQLYIIHFLFIFTIHIQSLKKDGNTKWPEDKGQKMAYKNRHLNQPFQYLNSCFPHSDELSVISILDLA